jgi:hypothetical protein
MLDFAKPKTPPGAISKLYIRQSVLACCALLYKCVGCGGLQDGKKGDVNEDSPELENAEPFQTSLPPGQSCDSLLVSKTAL